MTTADIGVKAALNRTHLDADWSLMGSDNVDRRLLVRFEASWEHERVRRELLPPVWISADLDDSGPLGELFEDVLGRARGHVRREREALAARIRLDHTV